MKLFKNICHRVWLAVWNWQGRHTKLRYVDLNSFELTSFFGLLMYALNGDLWHGDRKWVLLSTYEAVMASGVCD